MATKAAYLHGGNIGPNHLWQTELGDMTSRIRNQESEFRFISDQNKNQNIAENNVLQTIDQKLRIWQEIENCLISLKTI